MPDTLTISKVDEVYIRVDCDTSIAYELNDHFSFMAPGAQFDPRVRNRMWDGRIRLFNLMSRTIYAGLYEDILDFARKRDYETKTVGDLGRVETFDEEAAAKFIEELNVPKSIESRDYQIDSFVHAVRSSRALMLSPTASGKSFMIYLLTRYYAAKTLIIVPRAALVKQMCGDFEDYGLDVEKYVHMIPGKTKDTKKPITITTWQSIQSMPKKWFEQFEVVIGDEAHGAKAKVLVKIMSSLTRAYARFGFTGTLDGLQTSEMTITGLFGPKYVATSTRDLMDSGHVSDLRIKAIVLLYSDEERKLVSKMDYNDELEFIVTHPGRMNFVVNLALSLKGNTIILYRFVEKHGLPLYEAIKKAAGESRNVFFVSGDVPVDEREDIRRALEETDDSILVASGGTFSTGTNIKNLHNLIQSSPSKSKILNLQSIGRVLRKHPSKKWATLYDIADDLQWKNSKNYTIEHFAERIRIYAAENFEYTIYCIQM